MERPFLKNEVIEEQPGPKDEEILKRPGPKIESPAEKTALKSVQTPREPIKLGERNFTEVIT